MSNRYSNRFAQLEKQGRKAFIPFTMLGWPNRKSCLATVATMIDSGVSALELGMAFSDPVADGPVIQRAASETIASGFTVADAFDLLKEIRSIDQDIPIGLLVYYNMVLRYGITDFFTQAHNCGVDGILIADLPPEAASETYPAARAAAVESIFIVSPLTLPDRLDTIAKYAGGFLYAVSRLGTTGVEERYDRELEALISRVKATSTLPVCVGFGISTAKQAQQMFALGADGAITGSKIVDLVRNTPEHLLTTCLQEYLTTMVRCTYMTSPAAQA